MSGFAAGVLRVGNGAGVHGSVIYERSCDIRRRETCFLLASRGS